ncbi:MAG TPA: ABC transporter permease [Prolixibacteraceae bacterium]|nr:ABC transporter permease [Prolixibacteraceae bacterium]
MHKNTPLFAVINRELSRIKQNPAYRFLLLFGPLTGIILFFFIFRAGVVRKLPIAVVDRDNSSLSIKITTMLDASSDVKVQLKTQNIFQAKQLLESGQIEAVIIIPREMEKLIYQEMEAPVPVYINGTNVLKAGLIQRSVLTTLKTVSGGIQLKKLMMTGKSETEAMARVVPVNLQRHVLFNPYTNYSYFLNSAMLFVMLYLFVFLSSIYTLGNELKRGTGKNLLETGNKSVRIAVTGKMLPYTIIFTGLAMFINLLLFRVEGMPLNGRFWLIFAGQIVTIITYQLLGLLFIGVTSNLRLALSLGSAYSMMAVTFSGLTFPLEAMPEIAQILATIFPFTWWEKLMISQSLRGAPFVESLPYIAYLLAFQLVAFGFLPLYKQHLGNSKHWGKK